jgi:glycosyltransferase involved in cell wall biosynthesis
MRVVHVAPTAFGTGGIYGGGERYPLELARAIAAHVDCTLLTFGRTGQRPRREDGGLFIQVLAAPFRLHRHPAHPLAPGLPPALGGFDVVHAHQVWATPSRMAAATARLRRQPVAVTDHGLLGSRPRPRSADRRVHRFLTVSRYSAEVLGVPEDRTTVIYGGVDPRRFSPGPPAVKRSGVLFVGRLTPHKGVDRLLQALPAGAELTVVGTAGHDLRPPESGYAAWLRRLAGEDGRRVRFLGAVSDAELLELYRTTAVMVLPSVEETCYGKRIRISELLGLSVLEAMACGAPVVASSLGGLREVVRHGETGFLFQPGDVDGLRRRLEELLGDPQLVRRLGDAAHQLATERFTWDACARRCLEAYEGMLATGA